MIMARKAVEFPDDSVHFANNHFFSFSQNSKGSGAFFNGLPLSHSSNSSEYPLKQVRYCKICFPFLPFFRRSAIILSTSYSGRSSKSSRFKNFRGRSPNSGGEV